jgi:hypothetical protein
MRNEKRNVSDPFGTALALKSEMSLTPLTVLQFADDPTLAIEEFFAQRPVEVSGTARNVWHSKSRRWQDGERGLRAANNTTWRAVA